MNEDNKRNELRDKLIIALAPSLYDDRDFIMDSRLERLENPFLDMGAHLLKYVDGILEAKDILEQRETEASQ